MAIKVLNIMTGGLRREGITSSQLVLCRNMNMSGIEMHIAAVHNNESDVIQEFENLGCKIIVFPDRQNNLLQYSKKLYQTIKEEKYDIVHVHGSSALLSIELLIAKFGGVKTRIAHSRNTRCNNVMMDRILRPIFYKSYTYAIACGKEAGDWLFGKHPFVIFHNGKELDIFKYSEATRNRIRTDFSLNNSLAIGYVGNINYVKNIPFLLEVFKSVLTYKSNAKLFIIGDGPERDKMQELSKELELENDVFFTGRISNVSEMIQAMDIMLLPSLYEGLPNVVLEWQIAGLPSIISNNITRECGVTDLVEYLPIDQGIDTWVKKIVGFDYSVNRYEKSKQACKAMIDNSFDIKENAVFIKNLYIRNKDSL